MESKLTTRLPWIKKLFQRKKTQENPENWSQIYLKAYCWLLFAGIFLLNPEVFLGSHTFFYRDFGFYGYPMAFYLGQNFGEWPLWNPLSNGGAPFLAQWSTMVMYPISWLFMLIPMPWSVGYFSIAHQAIAGIGMFLLARNWSKSSVGACVAGLSFALGGFISHSLMWPNYMVGWAWMPWVLLLGIRAVSEGLQENRMGARNLAKAVCVGSLQMLIRSAGNHPCDLGIVGNSLSPDSLGTQKMLDSSLKTHASLGGERWMCMRRSIIPIFLNYCRRAIGKLDGTKNNGRCPWWGIVNYLVPLFHSSPSLVGVYTQPDQQMTSSYFVGLITFGFCDSCIFQIIGQKNEVAGSFHNSCPLDGHWKNSRFIASTRENGSRHQFISLPCQIPDPPNFHSPAHGRFWSLYFRKTAFLTQIGNPKDWRPFQSIGFLLVIGIIGIAVWGALSPLEKEEPLKTLENGGVRLLCLLGFVFSLGALFRSFERSAEILSICFCNLDTHRSIVSYAPTEPSCHHASL